MGCQSGKNYTYFCKGELSNELFDHIPHRKELRAIETKMPLTYISLTFTCNNSLTLMESC